MRTLIANGTRELYSALSNEMHIVSPMSASSSGTLHDSIETSDSVAGFINKDGTLLTVPEDGEEFIGVCRLEVRIPLRVIQAVQHNYFHLLRPIHRCETFRQRRFAAFRHAENEAMAHGA